MSATLIGRLNLQRFWRGEGPERGPITLNRRRIFVLPTAHGLRFGVVLFAMLMGSMNYSNSLGFALTFLLGAIAVVSILHTYFNLAQLTFHSGKSEPVFCGQTAPFTLQIHNPSQLARYGIDLKLIDFDTPTVTIELAHHFNGVTLHQPANRRGRMRLGRCRVETRYPLGLFRAWSYIDLTQETLVYPRPAENAPLLPDQHLQPSSEGNRLLGEEDFAGLRPYQPGDTLSQIHWKVAARSDNLVIKQYGGGAAPELWLEWHRLQGMDTEQRLSILTRWVIESEQSNTLYGLRLPNREIELGHGEEHYHRCLEELACFGVDD